MSGPSLSRCRVLWPPDEVGMYMTRTELKDEFKFRLRESASSKGLFLGPAQRQARWSSVISRLSLAYVLKCLLCCPAADNLACNFKQARPAQHNLLSKTLAGWVEDFSHTPSIWAALLHRQEMVRLVFCVERQHDEHSRVRSKFLSTAREWKADMSIAHFEKI